MLIRRLAYAGTVATMAIAAVIAAPWSAPATSDRASAPAPTHVRDVVANLFEWNWASVAKECTTVLGPAGYGAVQVAPPQDSLKRTALGNGSDTVLHPWWEVYQPVDYNLTSRMGSENQFKYMVRTCRAAGVQVIVDAVINHTTGQGNLSYGGVTYEKYAYPGVYTNNDFHKYSGSCPTASGQIEDFNNQIQVFKCELVGLADLRTETSKVQGTLARYLNKLLGYGVSGFRVDAAKHIGQADLDAIYVRLNNTVDGKRPYWALEVFGGAPGTLSPFAFLSSGSVLGLDADVQLKNAFKSYPAEHIGSIATLKDFGVGSGLPPSNRTLTFVQNHDTERNGDALNFKDGATNIIATEFLLGWGYGRPEVYAGFTFGDDTAQSPPATTDGMITNTNCANGWSCTDRDPGVLAMVGFHNWVGTAPVRNWTDDGANLIGFGRGNLGWMAVNNATTAKTWTFSTGLHPGSYHDLIQGMIVNVGPNGLARVTVPAKGAVAITTK